MTISFGVPLDDKSYLLFLTMNPQNEFTKSKIIPIQMVHTSAVILSRSWQMAQQLFFSVIRVNSLNVASESIFLLLGFYKLLLSSPLSLSLKNRISSKRQVVIRSLVQINEELSFNVLDRSI